MNEKKVAWKDRIGLNQQWARDIQVCSECFGSDEYPMAVERFRNSIINIKDGPPLKDIINKFVSTELQEYVDKEYTAWRKSQGLMITKDDPIDYDEKERAEAKGYVKLFNFMLQLLEDNGFCFYDADYSGEYDEIS